MGKAIFKEVVFLYKKMKFTKGLQFLLSKVTRLHKCYDKEEMNVTKSIFIIMILIIV